MEPMFSAIVKADGAHYPADLPPDLTPLMWHEPVNQDTNLSARAEGMAMAGLYYGCNRFARISVVDRPKAEARGKGGQGVLRRRERQFIVYALGWREE